MERLARITIDPNICHGRPTIRGLRYTVEMVLELLSSGMTAEEIIEEHEDLEKNDILAALAYAASVTRVKRIEPAAAEILRPRMPTSSTHRGLNASWYTSSP